MTPLAASALAEPGGDLRFVVDDAAWIATFPVSISV
jgi:hypothetical protein